MKTIAFFGHRQIFNQKVVEERVIKTLQGLMLQGGVRLLIGCHGDFDNIVLSTSLRCKKSTNINMKIGVVLTSLSFIKKDKYGYSRVDGYKNLGCETIFYDIEEEYFKNRITYSNKKMVEESDLIVCYVDMNARVSGAKKAVNYALKQNKKVINLFEERDRII